METNKNTSILKENQTTEFQETSLYFKSTLRSVNDNNNNLSLAQIVDLQYKINFYIFLPAVLLTTIA
jgi:hypothetical protein